MKTLRMPWRHAPIGTLAVLALVAAACTNDNNSTTAPTGPQFVASFVGYSNPDTKQTTCGNCHVEKQNSWAKTGHAKAWGDLQASGHATSSCNQCHTVNGTSNIGVDSGGYLSASTTAQKFFDDVQCESCHGPGQAHVTVPDSTQPIPYFTSRDTTVTGGPVGCGTCHSGTHDPFYENWSAGAHDTLLSPAISNTTAPTATNLACKQCHEGRQALARWENSTTYVEATSTTYYPVGCTTCHDPHGNSSNTHELYQSISVRDTTNLCIQCHKRRSVPDSTSASGPHSPQGKTFLGISGWQPTGFTWDSTNVPTHSNPTANPLMCATCHVESFNSGSGASAYFYTGHEFYAIPCVDPTSGAVIQTRTANTACPDAQRRFTACTASGCHASEDAARTLLASTQSDLQFIADLIWKDTNGNGKVDTTDAGLLAKVPQTEFKTRSATTTIPYTVAEGGRFNVQLLGTDGSRGAHNPAYLRALLVATYNAVKAQYHLTVVPAVQARVDAIQAR